MQGAWVGALVRELNTTRRPLQHHPHGCCLLISWHKGGSRQSLLLPLPKGADSRTGSPGGGQSRRMMAVLSLPQRGCSNTLITSLVPLEPVPHPLVGVLSVSFLHWQVDSSPLSHQGSPMICFYLVRCWTTCVGHAKTLWIWCGHYLPSCAPGEGEEEGQRHPGGQ